MMDERDLDATVVTRTRLRTPDVRWVALTVAVCTAVVTGAGVASWYGGAYALWFMLGLLPALSAQYVFVAALRHKIGPERSSLADALTLARASVGAALAGLVVAGIYDREGLAGWFAWSAGLLAASVLDWFDGPLARRLGPTRLGGAMDIEADSWLTLWLAVGAVAWGDLPWWCLLAPVAHYGRPLIALRRGGLPLGHDPWWGLITGGAQMLLIMAALAPVHGALRDVALAWVALPVSGAQLLVMLILVYRRMRIGEKARVHHFAR
jgi:phosphatidylglycerophosphate synthase